MNPVVGAEDGDERFAEIPQGGLAARSDLPLGHHDPERLAVLHLVHGVDAGGVVTENVLVGTLAHLDLGDQVAARGVPARELDARRPPDQAASSVAADEILGPQRLPVGEVHVNAPLVLLKPGHLAAVLDVHRQLGDPVSHDPLDLVLPDRDHVRVTRREIARVQHASAEHHHPMQLTPREESISDPTLIEHLDRTRLKAAGARAGQRLVRTPFKDRDINPRQRQLGRQHHPRRTTAGDDHRMLSHAHSSLLLSARSGLRRAIMGHWSTPHERLFCGINWK